MHRIGRAGRFGTKGAALTVLSNEKELYRFKLLVRRENLNIRKIDINDDFPHDLPLNMDYFDQQRKFAVKILFKFFLLIK